MKFPVHCFLPGSREAPGAGKSTLTHGHLTGELGEAGVAKVWFSPWRSTVAVGVGLGALMLGLLSAICRIWFITLFFFF